MDWETGPPRFYVGNTNSDLVKPVGGKTNSGYRGSTYQLGSYPTLSCLENCLKEVLAAPEGEELTVAWPSGSYKYLLTVTCCSFGLLAPNFNWKVYRQRNCRTETVFKQDTDDVMLIHNLILQNMGG
jgi:hypothetical protein